MCSIYVIKVAYLRNECSEVIDIVNVSHHTLVPDAGHTIDALKRCADTVHRVLCRNILDAKSKKSPVNNSVLFV